MQRNLTIIRKNKYFIESGLDNNNELAKEVKKCEAELALWEANRKKKLEEANKGKKVEEEVAGGSSESETDSVDDAFENDGSREQASSPKRDESSKPKDRGEILLCICFEVIIYV